VRPGQYGNDSAGHRVYFDFRGSLAAGPLDLEIPHQSTALALECDTLNGAGDAFQRDRAS